MKIDIDNKLLGGVSIGLLVGALVTGGVWAATGDSGKEGGEGSVTGGSDGSSYNGGGDDDDDDKRSGAKVGPPPALPIPEGEGKVRCPQPTTTVSGADELQQALSAAKPGDVIRMAPGTYQGKFVAQTSGTADRPIFLCGDSNAILDGGGVRAGYGFHLNKASFWRLVGFTVQNSQKGVMADTTRGSIVQGLTVHDIGDEAIHLRNFSTGNIVQYNKIYNTGLRREKFGEGVYLGTAESNWERFSGGRMDKSDNNVVRGNVIRATAEAIDIKEGTSGGRIINNIFDGSATGGDKHNDSWVDVKGNNYLIEGNRGKQTPLDGFQTHKIVDGWGVGNVFRNNTIDLGTGTGVGINDTAGGNKIACDNKVTGGQVTSRGECA